MKGRGPSTNSGDRAPNTPGSATTSFTIVTPSFNGGQNIRRCVGSVRGQTDVRYEHLIEDGGSTDESLEWILRQPDLNVTSRQDGGMYDAINHGLNRSTGDVLSWLNVDEQYLPGALVAVARALGRHPEADFVYGAALLVSPEGEPLASRREIPLRQLYLRNGPLYALSCTMFFRRRLLDCGDLHLDDGYRIVADADLVLRLLERKRRAIYVKGYLGLFGIDGNNLSTRPSALDEIERLRARHGALRSPAARRLLLRARHFERLLSGCYTPVPVSFDFALDDVPSYKRVTADRVPPSWTFDPGLPISAS